MTDAVYSRSAKANKVTWIGLLVNVALTLLKLAAGISGRSAAMIADGFHSLSDFATDIVVLIGFRFIGKPVDKSHDYGHGKIETLAAVIIGVSLCAVGLRIFWTGALRVFDISQGATVPEPGWVAFYAAVFSILVKESLYRYTIKAGQMIHSQAVIANAWHHRSDALSSVGTMLGIGGAILLGERWHVLDPAAAMIVSFFILRTSIAISLRGVNELLEASLGDKFEERILNVMRSVPGVITPHELRTRRIGNYIAIDVHIEVDPALNITEAHDIATRLEERVKNEFGEETFISVHVEPLE